MAIRIMCSTRQEPAPAALAGSVFTSTVSGLIAASAALPEQRRLVCQHTDSDARLWLDIDGRAVNDYDLADIEMAERAQEKRTAAKRILGQ
jgi:hypothetical protein